MNIFSLLILVDCGSLSNPANGRVAVPATTVESKASYSCRFGFKLIGNVVRECLSSGSWSGLAPTCRGELFITVFSYRWLADILEYLIQSINLIRKHWK